MTLEFSCPQQYLTITYICRSLLKTCMLQPYLKRPLRRSIFMWHFAHTVVQLTQNASKLLLIKLILLFIQLSPCILMLLTNTSEIIQQDSCISLKIIQFYLPLALASVAVNRLSRVVLSKRHGPMSLHTYPVYCVMEL